MKLSIDPLAPQHFEGLRRALDIVAREKRFLAFTEAPPLNECSAFYQSIIDNGWCQQIASVDGEVVGWCDVLPVHGQAKSHVGTLGMGLVPAARHRGIGRQLIDAAIEAAWASGLTRIELTVRAENLNAKALYERVGFQVEGLQRKAFCVDGAYGDSWTMALLKDDAGSGLPANRSMPAAQVIPVLAYADVAAASAWLCEAFGFTERLRIGDHRVQLSFGSGDVVVRAGAADSRSDGMDSVMVRVDDVDAHHATALRAGAKVTEAPTTHPFGERQYGCEDIGGHRWTFSQSVRDVAPEDWLQAAGD